MPKTKLSDILKDGKTELSSKDVSFRTPLVRNRFQQAGVEAEKSHARKNVDWAKLSQWEIPWNGPRGPH